MNANDSKLYGPWSSLRCPGCGSTYTHQGQVEVFFDNDNFSGEGQRTSHVTVDERGAHVHHEDESRRNPSPRRDGVLIHFACELCEARPALAVFQHKGITYVAWDDTSAAVELEPP